MVGITSVAEVYGDYKKAVVILDVDEWQMEQENEEKMEESKKNAYDFGPYFTFI